jgi:5-dehydro-2-deoxygluconokinase
MRWLYGVGIKPDWWKLEPLKTDAAWRNVAAVVEANDPWCRGVVILGLEASEQNLRASFAVAARHPLVKGFAVGRTIFAEAAKAWLRGEIDDARAVAMMAERYRRLAGLWDQARQKAASTEKTGGAA